VQAYEVISRRVKSTGIPVAELARRTDIHQVLLGRSLHGERVLKADELIRLSRELNLQLSDFDEAI
jgi:hypothetical protein